MENSPDYSSYTLDELYDAYHHINREHPPNVSINDTLADLGNVINYNLWINELEGIGLHLADPIKSLVSQLLPFVNFEKAVFSITKSKFIITFSPVKNGPILIFPSILLLYLAIIFFGVVKFGSPLMLIAIPLTMLALYYIRLYIDIKFFVNQIEINFYNNIFFKKIPIQFVIYYRKGMKKTIDINQIEQFYVREIAYQYFPGYEAQFVARLTNGKKCNFGYFVDTETVKILCEYFNSHLRKNSLTN